MKLIIIFFKFYLLFFETNCYRSVKSVTNNENNFEITVDSGNVLKIPEQVQINIKNKIWNQTTLFEIINFSKNLQTNCGKYFENCFNFSQNFLLENSDFFSTLNKINNNNCNNNSYNNNINNNNNTNSDNIKDNNKNNNYKTNNNNIPNLKVEDFFISKKDNYNSKVGESSRIQNQDRIEKQISQKSQKNEEFLEEYLQSKLPQKSFKEFEKESNKKIEKIEKEQDILDQNISNLLIKTN